jgi:ABC-type transport system substrate-binding protein
LKLFKDPSFDFEGPNFPTDGPYQVVQHVRDERTVLRPMKYYDDMTCGGYVANIIDLAYASDAGVIAAAANRQVDITLGVGSIPQLEVHRDAYHLHVDPTFTFEHVIFNVDRTYQRQPNPLADTAVRQALALAVDKPKVIRDALSTGAFSVKDLVAWTPWIVTSTLVAPFADPKVVGQWDPIAKRFVTDTGHGAALADARKLLASTRWRAGFPLDFVTLGYQLSRQVEERDIAASWASLGVKVNSIFLSYSQFNDDWDHGGRLPHGVFQAALFAEGSPPDPDGWRTDLQSQYIDREQLRHRSINANYSGIHDAIFDRDFDVAGHSFSTKVRFANYAAIQKQLDQQAYWLGLYSRPFISTADSRVLNFTGSPFDFGEDWNTYEWKVQ